MVHKFNKIKRANFCFFLLGSILPSSIHGRFLLEKTVTSDPKQIELGDSSASFILLQFDEKIDNNIFEQLQQVITLEVHNFSSNY